jgi:DNA polymerase I-like protein with 3'-5' exonuclease and polymerase domains/uracil-DNA glycosylase
MLVADYPTEAEAQAGMAFTDSGAQMLFKLMREAGYTPDSTWRTHYYKRQIPGYGSKKEKDKKAALTAVEKSGDWRGAMFKELSAVKPNLVIAIGDLALRGLTGHSNITKRAGSFYNLIPELQIGKPCRVLAINSPRTIYIRPEERMLTRLDLTRGLPFAERAVPIFDDFTLTIGKDPTLVRDWLKAYKRNIEFGVFDVETHHNLVTCICFCFDGKHSISVPLLDRRMSVKQLAWLWHYVYYTLIDPTIPWVNQNIKYDINRLEAMKFRISRTIGDTMLRASVIHPELPKGLDFLTRLYTNVGYYKDEGKEFDPKIHDFERMMLYNAKDGIATHRVYTGQERDIKYLGIKPVNDNLQRSFFVYKHMEDTGICVDHKRRRELIEYYSSHIEVYEAEMDALAGRPINVRSGDQLGPLLLSLGADPKIRTWDEEKNKWKYSTGKVELEDLYVHVSDKPELAYIAEKALVIRKLYKLKEFCEYYTHHERGLDIVRTSFKLHGTETGRTATGKLLESIYVLTKDGKPDWEQPGFSVQQQPKHPWEYLAVQYGPEFRSQFVPRPGYVFVEFDLSQAEARVVDVLAENYDALEEYGKIDKHCKTAAIVLQTDYESLYRRYKYEGDFLAKRERQRGKSYKHAFNYDETAFNLSRRAHIPFSDADVALRRLAEADPRIKTVFHATIERQLQTTRELITPYGRRRTFYAHYNNRLLKEGYAYIPQSTIPDHMRFDIINDLFDIVGKWANLLVEWHDSLLAEVPEKRVDEYREHAERLAKTPIRFKKGTFVRNYDLVIPTEFSIGTENWQHMKDIK